MGAGCRPRVSWSGALTPCHGPRRRGKQRAGSITSCQRSPRLRSSPHSLAAAHTRATRRGNASPTPSHPRLHEPRRYPDTPSFARVPQVALQPAREVRSTAEPREEDENSAGLAELCQKYEAGKADEQQIALAEAAVSREDDAPQVVLRCRQAASDNARCLQETAKEGSPQPQRHQRPVRSLRTLLAEGAAAQLEAPGLRRPGGISLAPRDTAEEAAELRERPRHVNKAPEPRL